MEFDHQFMIKVHMWGSVIYCSDPAVKDNIYKLWGPLEKLKNTLK